MWGLKRNLLFYFIKIASGMPAGHLPKRVCGHLAGKTAGRLDYALEHQIMGRILPLSRGIILCLELLQSLTNTLTATQQSQVREIETAHKLLEIFQEPLFIRHSAHHLERMRP